MKKDSFVIHDVEPQAKTVNYVVLQGGKGKASKSSIYISAFAFSYIEGLIWNKYREYSVKKKVKIPKQEWTRIIEGIQVANDRLAIAKDNTDIESILKFSISTPKNALSLLVNQMEEFLSFTNQLNDWLSGQISSESNITVIKNYL